MSEQGARDAQHGAMAEIADMALSGGFGRKWAWAFAVSCLFVLMLIYALVELSLVGVGQWGTNVPFVWGFDITNYAWWISLANGTSLFAAILVLRRHGLRTSINRFAEGLALAAVICAAVFPVFHLGRPWLFYWVVPYPATYEVWPQFRSPLIWDFWAISSHVIVTGLLWYLGLIPDLAALRDRAKSARARLVYGLFALGWRGSARQWAHHQSAYRFVALTALPILLVTQSTVAFEFAGTLTLDWRETRQPLHFVVTGLAAGLGLVLFAAAALRSAMGLHRYIDERDMSLIGYLTLTGAVGVGYLYIGGITAALLSDDATRVATSNRFFGPYAFAFWGGFALMALAPQALWWSRARQSVVGGVLIGLGMCVGVWLDRFSIVVAGVQRDYLPAMWRSYAPTLSEWLLLFGAIGLFAALFLLLVRFVPIVPMFESRHREHGAAEPGAAP